MKIFSYRYSCIIISFFMAGCLLGSFIDAEHRYILLSSFAILSFASPIARFAMRGRVKAIYSKKQALLISLSTSAIALSMLSCIAFYDLSFRDAERSYDKESSYTMEVTEVYLDKAYATEFKAKLLSCDGEDFSIKHSVFVSLDYGADVAVGDIMSCIATINDADNSAIDDYYFYRSNECYITCDKMEDIDLIGRSTSIPFKLSGVQRKLSEYITSYSEQSSPLMKSLLLGDRSELSPSLKLDFKRLGISHILALSGLHLSVISLGLEFVLRKLRIHKTARFVIELLFVLFYVTITGFSISVIRAAIMLAAVAVTYFLWCDYDSMTALFISAFVICFISPASIINVSFLLSFLATFGVLAYIEFSALRDKRDNATSKKRRSFIKRTSKKLIDSFFISAFACIMTFGVSILYFEEFSPYAPIFNIFFCPIFTVYIYLSAIALPFLKFAPIARICDACSAIIVKLVHSAADIPNLLKSSRDSIITVGIILAVILILYALIADLKTKKKISIVIASSFSVFVISLLISNLFFANEDKIIYQRSDENEQIIIKSNGDVSVCDISDGYSSTLYELSRGIYRCGATEIDSFIITHYHEAYTRSIRKLSGVFKIHEISLPTPESQYEEGIYREIVAVAIEEGIECIRYDRNEDATRSAGTAKLLFADYPDKYTHKVMAMRFETDNNSLLYISDMLHKSSDLPRDLLYEISYAECIFFGAHGPKYDQSEIPYDSYSDKLESFSFYDREVAFYAPRTGEHLKRARKFTLPSYFELEKY